MTSNWFKEMLLVSVQETNKVLKDSGLLLFFIIVPVLYPLLYAYLYNNENIREVPVVVVDECGSSLSREFLSKSDATPDIRIVAHCSDFEEAQEMIRNHMAYGIIYVPAEFSRELAYGRQATVNLYCDMSGLLYYKCIYSGCTHVSLEMNKEIKMSRMGGISQHEMNVNAMPVEYDYVTMYNPRSGFCTYLIPAILVLIIQQTLVLGITLLAGTEREERQKGINLVGEFDAHPLSVFGGKTICYVCFYTMVCVYSFWLLPKLFHLPQMWHPHDLIQLMIPMLLASIFFAMTISFFVRERESCFLLFMFMSVPLLFMSGISWPRSAMPGFWKAFSCLFPSTFGINGYVRMANMGATLHEVRRECIWLWAQAAFYASTTVLIYIRLYRSTHMPDFKYMSKAAIERFRKRIGR